MKPTPGMQFLQSLQGDACGTHFLINFLKLFNETASLNGPILLDPDMRYFLSHDTQS